MAHRILLLTRADAEFGHGHLSRSVTLAQALRRVPDTDVQVVLLGDETALKHARSLGEEALFHPAWELKWASRRKLLAGLLRRRYPFYKPHVVVFDMYDFADTFWARDFFPQLFPLSVLFGLDVYTRRSPRMERARYRAPQFHYVVNSLLAPFGALKSETGGQKRFIGTDYLILPPELTQLKRWKPAKHQGDAPVPVFLGGGEVVVAPALVKALGGKALRDRRFAFITSYQGLLHGQLPSNVEAWPLADSRKAFYKLFLDAPFGLASCGLTLYELSHLGVPLVLVPVVAHQVSTAGKFSAAGFGVPVLPAEQDFADVLAAAVEQMDDEEFRRGQSDTGRKLVDGGGLKRVIALIKRAVKEASRKLA
jgi:spore coat polysaccharide biosynthesis predicted glycosyltransferase SpsG